MNIKNSTYEALTPSQRIVSMVDAIAREDETEINLHLTTNSNAEYIDSTSEAFRQMTDSLEPLGINFTYQFDENIHDRSIDLNNGWKILLGRGLDIFQKTGGWYDISEYYQEKRQCKACEVTVLKK